MLARIGQSDSSVRLGLRLTKGLREDEAARIVLARAEEPYASVQAVARRSEASVSALERLLRITTTHNRKASEAGSQASPTMHVFTAQDINNALNGDAENMFSQSPLLGLDLDSSPYALMESIVWGAQKSP